MHYGAKGDVLHIVYEAQWQKATEALRLSVLTVVFRERQLYECKI